MWEEGGSGGGVWQRRWREERVWQEGGSGGGGYGNGGECKLAVAGAGLHALGGGGQARDHRGQAWGQESDVKTALQLILERLPACRPHQDPADHPQVCL